MSDISLQSTPSIHMSESIDTILGLSLFGQILQIETEILAESQAPNFDTCLKMVASARLQRQFLDTHAIDSQTGHGIRRYADSRKSSLSYSGREGETDTLN